MSIAKPFLKWAGGKSQLITTIEKALPHKIYSKEFTYVEPFVGSGAVLFWMLRHFPNMKKAVINDVNIDLMNVYTVIAKKPKHLITSLQKLQLQYHKLDDDAVKKSAYYYSKREMYNTRNQSSIEHAALFIFLNRTCFNGLYRVNRDNFFNVPVGSYKKPTICDAENILAASEALQKIELLTGDFENTHAYASPDTFFYIDPPYKPLSTTSSFNSYAKTDFNDAEQKRLHRFCKKLHSKKSYWMLSNSDAGEQNGLSFFDELYKDFTITRVKAKRSINANPQKRGMLNELLITNYPLQMPL